MRCKNKNTIGWKKVNVISKEEAEEEKKMESK